MTVQNNTNNNIPRYAIGGACLGAAATVVAGLVCPPVAPAMSTAMLAGAGAGVGTACVKNTLSTAQAVVIRGGNLVERGLNRAGEGVEVVGNELMHRIRVASNYAVPLGLATANVWISIHVIQKDVREHCSSLTSDLLCVTDSVVCAIGTVASMSTVVTQLYMARREAVQEIKRREAVTAQKAADDDSVRKVYKKREEELAELAHKNNTNILKTEQYKTELEMIEAKNILDKRKQAEEKERQRSMQRYLWKIMINNNKEDALIQAGANATVTAVVGVAIAAGVGASAAVAAPVILGASLVASVVGGTVRLFGW